MPSDYTTKEYYSLWWEYLRRSEYYQDYVSWYKSALKRKTHLPDKFRIEGLGKKIIFRENVKLFAYCDATNLGFDEFWKLRKHRWVNRGFRHNYFLTLYEFLKRDPFFSVETFQEITGKNPGTAKEFLDYYLDFESPIPRDFVIDLGFERPIPRNFVIDLSFGSPQEIKKAVQKALKKYGHKDHRRTRFDELKKYLKIYDLSKEGLKVSDIIKAIGDKAEKDESDDPDIQRKYRRYIQKAKIIIENTEKGHFPSMGLPE